MRSEFPSAPGRPGAAMERELRPPGSTPFPLSISGRFFFLRRALRDTLALFLVTIAALGLPLPVRLALLAGILLAGIYLIIQLFLTRFCARCGLPVPIRPWIARRNRCGCGGEYRHAWRSPN